MAFGRQSTLRTRPYWQADRQLPTHVQPRQAQVLQAERAALPRRVEQVARPAGMLGTAGAILTRRCQRVRSVKRRAAARRAVHLARSRRATCCWFAEN